MSRCCIHSRGNEARLKIIDRINKAPEPVEILAVKVYHQSWQVDNIRTIHFIFQSPGCSDNSLGQEDVMKLICQLPNVVGAELGGEPDYKFAMYIPNAVLATIEMPNPFHRIIHGTYTLEERKVGCANIVTRQ